jgi:class 3 adenylate cyclase
VSYAARIASAAEGGEIVVSELVHALWRRRASSPFEEARHVELKGIDGVQKVYPLSISPPAELS